MKFSLKIPKKWYESFLLTGHVIEETHFPYSIFTYTSSETSATSLAPPVLKDEGYHLWASRMEENDLHEAIEEDYEVPPLHFNPTMAQIRNQKEKKRRKSKARTTLFAAFSSEIFVRIWRIKSEL